MATIETGKQFQKIVEEIKKDQNVLAFWIDGARGKGMETENSDYDARMIVKDNVVNQYKEKYGSKKNPEIEISIMTFDELKEHAKYGSEMSWDRYNFAHLKVMFDRTGEIQVIIDSKSMLSKKDQDLIIKDVLGAFINQVYRLEKNARDGNLIAAKFDAIEAIPFLLEAIFALEGNVRPYNKYLVWELDNYPLEKFPWKRGELVSNLTSVIDGGQLHKLLDILLTIRPIFKDEGYSEEFDEWKGYYKVGE
ncbi:hypothetical protein KKH43_03240 [Patescibacteria group bacterium]|nr:hypothetical protein [Patescibacteria group bacterium]